MDKINIIYLLPEMKGASGGAKVIYNHSLILNNLNKKINSKIIHLKKNFLYKLELSLSKRFQFFDKKKAGWDGKKMRVSRKYRPKKDWHKNKILVGDNINFDKKKDFIIIPEIWAHFAVDLKFAENGINYAIFVQGFYHMNSTDNFLNLKKSYENAGLIITTSKNSVSYLRTMFPNLKKKILKVNLSVDTNKFKIKKKSNLITYMPRKLPEHSNLLLFYLKNLLPKNWKILPLINLTEKKLIQSLSKSKIFLSFSNFEGMGLPPIEAALSGNKVIGYVGGGGSEYWTKPIFIKVENGEIEDFARKIIRNIKSYKSSWVKDTKKNRLLLSKYYSKKSEKESLIFLSNKILKFFK
ncbi:glycosyltransferase [Candidatus Pelagibacter ubique]|uniref:glycosyltransferase n=1 Tax=Pelagibacter ubique TaxID=198252 RepID=UPI0003D1B6AD